jgi:hypothetical protein
MHVKVAALFDELCSERFGGLSDLLFAGWTRPGIRGRLQNADERENCCGFMATFHLNLRRIDKDEN